MADLFDFYNINPVAVVDQNTWDDKVPEVLMNFQRGPSIFTPLIDWTDRSQVTGAAASTFTDLLEGDIDNDEIGFADNYIEQPNGIDSRFRKIAVKRYGDKVQVHKSTSYFNQWKMSGGRDWTGLLRGVLGNNVRRKMEILSRNAYLLGPQSYWTYAGGATNFNTLDAGSKFGLDMVNAWNLRIGSTGTPVIPGDASNAKLVIVPPGSMYDFQEKISALSSPDTQWLNAQMYKAEPLRYETGSYKGVRFVVNPSDNYGMNSSVLYNAGKIAVQSAIKVAITAGDGSPDPETTAVDGTWYVGQKDVAHYITVASGTGFAVNDVVSIHTQRTDAYGVTNGVNFLSGKTVVRRIVKIDGAKLSFDRPIMKNYNVDLGSTVFGYVTKAVHVGMNLVLGSRGGIMGSVNKPLEFYDPRPVDDFNSVFRFTYDMNIGFNIWEPNLFEIHFTAVSLPTPGGVITPEDLLY